MSARVVVRGSGSIGRRHATVFAGLGAHVLLWPVRPRDGRSVDADTGVELVDDRTGPAACADADLVVVATDTSRHVADAVVALDEGCSRLLLEKPVAPTLADARVLQAHPRSGRVFVAAPLRAHRGFRELRLRLGSAGAPLAAHVRCQSWLPDWRPGRDYRESYSARADEGGVLRDLVHEIDYTTVLLGEPTGVTALLARSGPLVMEAEQAATLMWATPTATVTMRLDYITRPSRRRIDVSGPGGSLSWDVGSARVRSTALDGTVDEVTFTQDLDRDHVMGVQAKAALELSPMDHPGTLLGAGAPATLAQGCLSVRVCDNARTAAPQTPTPEPEGAP